ncbi:MAG: NUDIX hydrolase [Wenzhouxiangellaceae bacterium]|nr:NUDIX hydrolase [Wenzhouxiangellaceae bacterium]
MPFDLRNALDNYAEADRNQFDIVTRFNQLLTEHAGCFERSCWAGHITGSAWIVDPAGERVLLTHHRKLDRWLQPGGHSDGDPDTLAVALREAEEETGLTVSPVDRTIFDLDIHPIPARGDDPEHEHFDVRFALRALTTDYVVSDESHDLAWVAIDELTRYTDEESVLRMARKWRERLG